MFFKQFPFTHLWEKVPKERMRVLIVAYKDPLETMKIDSTRFYFWLFIILHSLIWILIPTFTRPTVTHDTLEGITWGMQWQFGYYKHPFLTAWLCAGITQLFGVVGWPVYLLAQLAIATTFFAAWTLARQILAPTQALIAALALEGVLFYNINSYNITPDSLQSPLWALLILFFYLASSTQKLKYWLGTGVMAALCLCTKYQIIVLFIPMFLFCISNASARVSFKRSGIYIAIAVFLLLSAPHLLWLYQHHFITLAYALEIPYEYTHDKSVLNHIAYPLRYLSNNVLNIIGLFILLWPFYNGKKDCQQTLPSEPTNFQWQFLLFIVLGPITLSLILCIITGNYFAPRWSTPYYFALGILMMAYLRPICTAKNIKQFSITLIAFSCMLVLSKIAIIKLHTENRSDAFLPNQDIALSITKIWHQHYHRPLPFIAGSNYLVAGITPYMPDKPKPYLGWEPSDNPWIDEQALHTLGAVFIWDAGDNYYWDKISVVHNHLSESVRARFPELIMLPQMRFYLHSNKNPVDIGIALIPPR